MDIQLDWNAILELLSSFNIKWENRLDAFSILYSLIISRKKNGKKRSGWVIAFYRGVKSTIDYQGDCVCRNSHFLKYKRCSAQYSWCVREIRRVQIGGDNGGHGCTLSRLTSLRVPRIYICISVHAMCDRQFYLLTGLLRSRGLYAPRAVTETLYQTEIALIPREF